MRGPLIAAGTLVVALVAYGAYGATHMAPTPPAHHPQVFNMFAKLKSACDKDDGNLVTTDPRGTPTAFATPDGPSRYWCVSRDYLTAIGRAPQDPPPSMEGSQSVQVVVAANQPPDRRPSGIGRPALLRRGLRRGLRCRGLPADVFVVAFLITGLSLLIFGITHSPLVGA